MSKKIESSCKLLQHQHQQHSSFEVLLYTVKLIRLCSQGCSYTVVLTDYGEGVTCMSCELVAISSAIVLSTTVSKHAHNTCTTQDLQGRRSARKKVTDDIVAATAVPGLQKVIFATSRSSDVHITIMCLLCQPCCFAQVVLIDNSKTGHKQTLVNSRGNFLKKPCRCQRQVPLFYFNSNLLRKWTTAFGSCVYFCYF